MRSAFHFFSVPLFCLAIGLAGGASGAVISFSGAGDDNWSQGGNWVGGIAPLATDSALFTNTGAAAAAGTITNIVDAPFGGVIAGIEFQNTTGNFHTADLSGGTLLVNGNLTVNQNRRTTTNAAFTNGTLQVGATGSPQNIYVGRRTTSGSGSDYGILDLRGSTFNATLTNFLIGTTTTGGSGETARGVVWLGDTNVITATTLTVSDSPASGLGGVRSDLHFGFSNTLNVNTFTVAGQKGEALADIVPGGTLALASATGGRASLNIANNYSSGTGTNVIGILDLTGGTFNALLGTVYIGRHHSGAGSGKGTLIMGAGTMDATSIILAQPGFGGTSTNPLNTTGLIQFDGGTIIAGSITRGDGVATFDWNAGTLAVGTFGAAARPMNLANDGLGTLSPGLNNAGTTVLYGNYEQGPGATYYIQLGGYGQGTTYDFLNVTGQATIGGVLEVALMGAFAPNFGDYFDVVRATGGILNQGFGIRFAGDGTFLASIVNAGGGVEVLRLTFVPEPASLLLLGGGLAALGRRRRKAQKPHPSGN